MSVNWAYWNNDYVRSCVRPSPVTLCNCRWLSDELNERKEKERREERRANQGKNRRKLIKHEFVVFSMQLQNARSQRETNRRKLKMTALELSDNVDGKPSFIQRNVLISSNSGFSRLVSRSQCELRGMRKAFVSFHFAESSSN